MHASPPAPGGRVALTFDDGPDPLGTPAVLAALRAAHVRATFFVLGERVLAHPALFEQIRSAGHGIEVHGFGHRGHAESTRAEVAADIDRALEVLAAAGVRPTRWRLPYGVEAPFSAGLAASRGLTVTGWTLDSADWAGHSAGAMLAALEPSLAPGAIVLLHDGVGPGALRGAATETAALVAPLTAAARARGLEPGPLAGGAPGGAAAIR